MSITAAYVHLRDGAAARTVQVSEGLFVDLDERDRVVGVESLDNENWTAALAKLAMAGRLAVPDRGDLWR